MRNVVSGDKIILFCVFTNFPPALIYERSFILDKRDMQRIFGYHVKNTFLIRMAYFLMGQVFYTDQV